MTYHDVWISIFSITVFVAIVWIWKFVVFLIKTWLEKEVYSIVKNSWAFHQIHEEIRIMSKEVMDIRKKLEERKPR